MVEKHLFLNKHEYNGLRLGVRACFQGRYERQMGNYLLFLNSRVYPIYGFPSYNEAAGDDTFFEELDKRTQYDYRTIQFDFGDPRVSTTSLLVYHLLQCSWVYSETWVDCVFHIWLYRVYDTEVLDGLSLALHFQSSLFSINYLCISFSETLIIVTHMSLKAICEVVLYFESFKNIDLGEQGVYMIRARIRSDVTRFDTQDGYAPPHRSFETKM